MSQRIHPTPPLVSDELLSAYIDGELSAPERERVAQALSADGALRERAEQLQLLVGLLRQTPQVRAPRVFAITEEKALAAGIKLEGVDQPNWWRSLFRQMAPVASALAVLLLVVVGVYSWRGGMGKLSAPQASSVVAEVQKEVESFEPMAKSANVSEEGLATAVVRSELKSEFAKNEVVPAAEKSFAPEKPVESPAAAAAPVPAATKGVSIQQAEPASDTSFESTSADIVAPKTVTTTAAAGADVHPGSTAMLPPLGDNEILAADEVAKMDDERAAAPIVPGSTFVPDPNDNVRTAQLPWLRTLEYALLLVAALLVAAALILRKR